MLARPHAGRGATKAITNAIDLADALTTHQSVDKALEAWDEKQDIAGKSLVALGQQLGRALVLESPDWNDIDETTLQTWWEVITGTSTNLPHTWKI